MNFFITIFVLYQNIKLQCIGTQVGGPRGEGGEPLKLLERQNHGAQEKI